MYLIINNMKDCIYPLIYERSILVFNMRRFEDLSYSMFNSVFRSSVPINAASGRDISPKERLHLDQKE